MYDILLPGLLSLVDSQTAILIQTLRKFRGLELLNFSNGVLLSSNFLRPQNNHSNFFKDPNNQLPFCNEMLIFRIGVDHDMLLKFQTENKFLGT